MSDRAFVYLIAHEKDGRAISPVKVGIATDVQTRLSSVQVGNPYLLMLVEAWDYVKMLTARRFEEKFHRSHDDKNLMGEWFDIEPAYARGVLNEWHRDWIIDRRFEGRVGPACGILGHKSYAAARPFIGISDRQTVGRRAYRKRTVGGQ